MSVRCGNCKSTHPTAGQVKLCYTAKSSGFNYDDAGRQEHGNAPKDGYYTVDFGDGEHRTIRLKTQAANANFAPGEMMASYLAGPDNEFDYQGFAFVKPNGKFNVWKRFRAANQDTRIVKALQVVLQDPQAPAELYAQRSGNCYRCNRRLTVPESIKLGIGPTCRENLGVA